MVICVLQQRLWCTAVLTDGFVVSLSQPLLKTAAGGVSSNKEDPLWLLSVALPILNKDAEFSVYLLSWPVLHPFGQFKIFSLGS